MRVIRWILTFSSWALIHKKSVEVVGGKILIFNYKSILSQGFQMSYSFGILVVHAVETLQANSGHFNIVKGDFAHFSPIERQMGN